MNVGTAFGLALLIAGAVLLYFGFSESNSFASQATEIVTGSPTDRSMWMMIGGAALAAFGGVLAIASHRAR